MSRRRTTITAADIAAQRPTACHFCSGALPATGGGYVDGNHWTGDRYIRVAACGPCYQSGPFAVKPRAPRRPRAAVTMVPATDWNMLVAFHNGQKARRRATGEPGR